MLIRGPGLSGEWMANELGVSGFTSTAPMPSIRETLFIGSDSSPGLRHGDDIYFVQINKHVCKYHEVSCSCYVSGTAIRVLSGFSHQSYAIPVRRAQGCSSPGNLGTRTPKLSVVSDWLYSHTRRMWDV